MTRSLMGKPVVPGLDASIAIGFGEDLLLSAEGATGCPTDPIGESLYCTSRVSRDENDLLEKELHDLIETKQSAVLKGLAGVGKTTLLRYYFGTYRPKRVNRPQLLLWVNLKSKSSSYNTEAGFYRALQNRLEEAFGIGFALRRAIWEEYIDRYIGEERLAAARKQGTEDVIIREEITKWSQDDRAVVEEFVRLWKKENDGTAFVVIDNVDTMDLRLQADALKFALDQREEKFGKFVDCMILTVRPETLKSYAVGQQLDLPAEPLTVDPLLIESALIRRIEYVRDALGREPRQMQTLVNVTIPKPDDLPAEASGYWGLPSSPYPQRISMLNLCAHEQVMTMFEKLAKAVDIAFGRSDTPDVRGARDKQALAVYRYLCGRSMRRSIQISRVVLKSEGMTLDAVRDSFRPYVFLDALVDTGLSREDSYISNVYQIDELTEPAAILFLPVLLQVLTTEIDDNAKARRQDDLGPDDQRMLGRQEVEASLGMLGFPKHIIDVGLKAARESRFVQAIYGEEFKLSGYVVNRNLVLAHGTGMWEAAYTDNMAHRFQNVSDLSGIKKTVGYRAEDLGHRSQNSLKFISWLCKNEVALFRQPSFDKARGEWLRRGIQSIAYGVSWHYASRLVGMQDTAPARSVKTINNVVRAMLREAYVFGLTKESLRIGKKFVAKKAGEHDRTSE
ncbi:ATP-binding protein [bacterium]|nr:ATP-binding protein [bacterium]